MNKEDYEYILMLMEGTSPNIQAAVSRDGSGLSWTSPYHKPLEEIELRTLQEFREYFQSKVEHLTEEILKRKMNDV